MMMLCNVIFGPIEKAWNNDTETIWGKIAVIVFNSLIWFMILTSLYSVIVPSSEGTNCILDGLLILSSQQQQQQLQLQDNDYPDDDNNNNNEYLLIILSGLIRVLNWFGIGFFVGLIPNQIYWMNVMFLAIIMTGAWMNNYIMSQSAMSITDLIITKECWDSVLLFNIIFAIASCAIVVLVIIEKTIIVDRRRRSRRTNNREDRRTTTTTNNIDNNNENTRLIISS